jgi:transposase
VIVLPSLSQLDAAGFASAGASPTRIWLAVLPADMRCGFDRLAELAKAVTGQDPFSGHLFLFRSRGGDRLKILYWDRDGFALWYKRLEEGGFYRVKRRGSSLSSQSWSARAWVDARGRGVSGRCRRCPMPVSRTRNIRSAGATG